jgi:uncharacterized membrane protein
METQDEFIEYLRSFDAALRKVKEEMKPEDLEDLLARYLESGFIETVKKVKAPNAFSSLPRFSSTSTTRDQEKTNVSDMTRETLERFFPKNATDKSFAFLIDNAGHDDIVADWADWIRSHSFDLDTAIHIALHIGIIRGMQLNRELRDKLKSESGQDEEDLEIVLALKGAGGNVKKAANELKLARSTVFRRINEMMKRYGVPKEVVKGK